MRDKKKQKIEFLEGSLLEYQNTERLAFLKRIQELEERNKMLELQIQNMAKKDSKVAELGKRSMPRCLDRGGESTDERGSISYDRRSVSCNRSSDGSLPSPREQNLSFHHRRPPRTEASQETSDTLLQRKRFLESQSRRDGLYEDFQIGQLNTRVPIRLPTDPDESLAYLEDNEDTEFSNAVLSGKKLRESHNKNPDRVALQAKQRAEQKRQQQLASGPPQQQQREAERAKKELTQLAEDTLCKAEFHRDTQRINRRSCGRTVLVLLGVVVVAALVGFACFR